MDRIRNTGPLALAALLLTLNGLAAADCRAPLHTGRGPGDVVPPMTEFANDILRADLAAAKALKDPIAAIARLQQNQFSSQHPQLEDSHLGYLRERCADQALYVALDDAIRARVRELEGPYRQARRFLSTGGQEGLANSAVSDEAGLLNLLLTANLYKEFETEAAAFLRSAVGDGRAADHFEAVDRMIEARRSYLERLQQEYAEEFRNPVTRLLPRELTGIDTLADATERLDPIRAEHVKYWLEKEAQSYQQVLAEKPAAGVLLELPFTAGIATEQLQLALDVALPRDQPRLRQRAERRGDELSDLNFPTAAAEYYQVAGLDQKAEAARDAVDARLETQAERLKEQAELEMSRMRKSDAEREAFEDETDALADELGIDLDDF